MWKYFTNGCGANKQSHLGGIREVADSFIRKWAGFIQIVRVAYGSKERRAARTIECGGVP